MTEGTFDAYNWGLIENKQKFIGQLMSGKNPSRSCEDVDEAALSYAEVKALASGDPRIMEKTDLDSQVTKLKLLKANHESQRYALEDKLIKFFPQAIKREKEMIADLEKDVTHLEAYTPTDKEHFSMTVMGTAYTEKKEAGQALIAAFDSLKDLNDKVALGEYRGFPMTLWVSDTGISQKLQITLKHERSHTIEPGNDPFGNITRLDGASRGLTGSYTGQPGRLQPVGQQCQLGGFSAAVYALQGQKMTVHGVLLLKNRSSTLYSCPGASGECPGCKDTWRRTGRSGGSPPPSSSHPASTR